MSENFLYGNGTNRLYGVSDTIDSDSSLTVASSKAIKITNDKIASIENDVTTTKSTATEALEKANNALPKTGGSLTGSVSEKLLSLSGTNVALDLTSANNFAYTVTDNTTLTMTANSEISFQLGTLVLTNGGSHTVTWPESFKWADDTPPTLNLDGIDVITFFTIDGGIKYYAVQSLTGVV